MQTTDSTLFDRPALLWEKFDSYADAVAFVERNWPDARHVGMGHWKIPHTADILYSVLTIRYAPMRGQEMPDPAKVA